MPQAHVAPDDVHIGAGNARTGEILCYLAIERVGPEGPAQTQTTLRELDRPPIALEQVHGWGIFNRLRVLPDLPLGRVREKGGAFDLVAGVLWVLRLKQKQRFGTKNRRY